MSLENCLPRVFLMSVASCALFSSTASANFVTNDPRLPAPAHFTFDTTVFATYATPAGTFHIDSFFDVFTELQRVQPPQLGTPPQIDSFFDVFTELSMSHDSNPPELFRAPAQCDISTECVADDGTTRLFDTEMLSMTLTGGQLPQGVVLRESPTLPSRGQASISDVGGGLYQVDSFFDIWTELSLDGGQTWTPSAGPFRLTGIPEPTTLSLLAGASVLFIRRRRA